MKCAIHKLALMLFMLCALTGSADTVPQRELFGASFTNDYYTPGTTPLCDTGAVHGTWGRVPDGAAISEAEVVAGKTNKYMACSTSGDGIVFTPTTMSARKIYSAAVSVRTSGYEDASNMPRPIGARAAFSICAPEGGKANYKGWVCSQNCWTNLYPVSGSSVLAPNGWQDVMVRFLKLDDSNDGYVQYWLKRPEDGDDYVPLKTEDGISWIRTGANTDGKMLGKIGLTGDGGLERILGREARRGLIVGVGSWYRYLLDESIYVHYNINEGSGNTNWWENTGGSAMTRSDDLRSYVIDVGEGGDPVICHTPRRHAKEIVEVTEIEAQFTGGNDDDSIPADACARVRLVEMTDPDEACRFACLADGQWKTNMSWAVSADAKYTIEISIDNGNRTVTYRYKEGYGIEGGAYRDLCSGEMLPLPCSGKTMQVDFDGYGIVHKIKGRDN